MLRSNGPWIQSPTKKQVVAALILWLIGMACSLAALTNLFMENLFSGKNAMMIFLMVIATLTVTRILLNYRKSVAKSW